MTTEHMHDLREDARWDRAHARWHDPATDTYDPHPDDYRAAPRRPRCGGCDDPWCVTCHYRRTDSQQTQGDSR